MNSYVQFSEICTMIFRKDAVDWVKIISGEETLRSVTAVNCAMNQVRGLADAKMAELW